MLVALAAGCRSARDDDAQPRFRRVRPAIAFEMIVDAPSIPILDLRRPEEFRGPLGHLKRAVNIPFGELPDSLGKIAFLKEQTFLVYCRAGDDCGEQGALLLVTQGFENTVLMAGGIESWIADGFATIGRDQPEMPLPEDPGVRIPSKPESGPGDPHIPDPP